MSEPFQPVDRPDEDRRGTAVIVAVVAVLAILASLVAFFAMTKPARGTGHGPSPEPPPTTATTPPPPPSSTHRRTYEPPPASTPRNPYRQAPVLSIGGPLVVVGGDHNGPCTPTVTRTIVGTLRVDRGPATVRYRWWTADSAGPVREARFTGTGRQEQRVETTNRHGDDGAAVTGVRTMLEVLGAVNVRSEWAGYMVTCTPGASVGAVGVDLADVTTADCVRGHRFHTWADIRVTRGPATVRYRWLYSDGSPGPERAVAFAEGGPRTQRVTGAWHLASAGARHMKLEILGPTPAISAPIHFRLACVEPVHVAPPVLSHTYYNGYCGGGQIFQFETYLSVRTAPVTVRYRWHYVGHLAGAIQSVSLTPGVAYTVRDSWTFHRPSESGRYAVYLEVLDPVGVDSPRAGFEVICT